MSAHFITSCGTGIGKTFATCALIHAAHMHGKTVQAFKPIASGFDATDAISDTAQIATALQKPISSETINAISPWRFTAPLSPNMAAAREGITINVDAVIRWSRMQLQHEGLTLIEGVGGVMVPLNDTHTVRDWIAVLGIPVILVTGSYLGSISHTLTAVEALRIAGISIKALIISESEGATVALEETLATLNHFTLDIPLRIAQPRVSSPAHATEIHTLLKRLR